MLRRDADRTFDAFLALVPGTALSAAEYHAVVRVLLGASRTRLTARRTLAVIEHAKRARARAAAAGDALVFSELDALVRDAFLWNGVLASIAAARQVSQGALDELFDVFAAGEGAAGASAQANRFPNIISYNKLLHAIACRAGTRHGPRRAGRIEQLFDATWARLCADARVAPDAVSWTTRIVFYTRTGQRERIGACTREMHARGVLTAAGVNAALWAYVRLWHLERRGDLAPLMEVYRAVKESRACATAIPTLPALPAVSLGVATCAILIRVLAARGDLAGALDVLDDLVALRPAPASVYHSLFRGFVRHGRGARVDVRHTDPLRCTWHVPRGTQWTMTTLVPLYEGYLHAEGRSASRAAAALRRVSGNDMAWVRAQLQRLTCRSDPPGAGAGSTH